MTQRFQQDTARHGPPLELVETPISILGMGGLRTDGLVSSYPYVSLQMQYGFKMALI